MYEYLLQQYWLASEHRGQGFAIGLALISCSSYGVDRLKK